MKIFKNRVFVAAICMFLAGIIAFVAIPIYNNLSLTRTGVVRASKDIAIGTQIKADMLETVEMGKLNLPESFGTQQLVVGQYAMTDIQSHDILTAEKVSKTLSLPNVKIRSLKPSEQAMTIAPHSEASTFAFRLLPNDIITVYETTDKGAQPVPELTYVSIVVESTSNGVQILKENQADADGNVLKPSTITFIANPIQTAKLIELNNKSNYYIVLKYRGSDEIIRQKYLEAQDEYFNGASTVGTVDKTSSTAGSATASVASK